MATSYDEASKWKIEHAGRVSFEVYQTIAGFFYGISVLCVIGRVAVRLAIRRRLLLDDCILLFALVCLSAATGLYYRFGWLVYVLNALKYDKTVMPTFSDLEQIMNAQAINYSLVALIWSAICPVKLCFLVSFKDLIRNVSRAMLVWYWSTVVVVVVYWALMIALPWIECPYKGTELLMHCTPEPPKSALLTGTWFAFTFDMLTDVMIVAIPIWILRHVRIRLSQKLAIATFLCLSLVIVLVALVRVCLSRYRGWGDLGTQYMLHHVEASIAVTMAAVASYRAVFVERSKRQEEEKQQNLQQSPQFRSPGESPRSLRDRVRKMRRDAYDTDMEFSGSGSTTQKGSEKSRAPKSYLAFPRGVGSKLGVMTFIRGGEAESATQRSAQEVSTFDSELAALESAKCPSSTTRVPGSVDGDSWKLSSTSS